MRHIMQDNIVQCTQCQTYINTDHDHYVWGWSEEAKVMTILHHGGCAEAFEERHGSLVERTTVDNRRETK